MFGQVEDERERVDDVVRTLHAAADADAFDGAGSIAEALGDDAVVLDVELLLRAGVILAFDDEVSGLKGRCESGFSLVLVAGVHQVGLEAVGGSAVLAARPDDARCVVLLNGGFGLLDGEHAGKLFIVDADCGDRGQQRGLMGMRE